MGRRLYFRSTEPLLACWPLPRRTRNSEEVQLGVHIPFVHRPLSEYVNALSENDLQLERMLEPSPPAGFLERNDSIGQHIPRLLVLICRALMFALRRPRL